MIDLDTYREILDTLTRNKSRSLLTGFGIFWGVFMLVFLIGGGQGLNDILAKNFEGFATNSGMLWAQNTTKPYKGFRKGRQWNMDTKDMERLREQVPELDVVAPAVNKWGARAVRGDKTTDCSMKGLTPQQALIETPALRYGRYINEVDMRDKRKVAVIGKKIYNNLFPAGGDPCGEMIRIDSTYYRVVGVDVNESEININGASDEAVTVPMSYMSAAYNYGDKVFIAAFTVRRGVKLSEVTPRVREVVARAHSVDPADEQAVRVFNTEVMFGMLDNLFRGVDWLIWLVGIGTLLAGAIGVSNIMMVTVRERTVEIGIRRAIGATPRVILSQIMAESVALTAVAGMSGILFAVGILQMLQLGTTTDGIPKGHFQVGFYTALGAVALLAALGMLAGLAPAARAMGIKPVDAMRDE